MFLISWLAFCIAIMPACGWNIVAEADYLHWYPFLNYVNLFKRGGVEGVPRGYTHWKECRTLISPLHFRQQKYHSNKIWTIFNKSNNAAHSDYKSLILITCITQISIYGRIRRVYDFLPLPQSIYCLLYSAFMFLSPLLFMWTCQHYKFQIKLQIKEQSKR